MLFTGGRPCPKGHVSCSQSAYQCVSCGRYDFGDEPGMYAHLECFVECEEGYYGEVPESG